MAGLQQLGYFIAVLESPQRVPVELLTQYVEIIEQTKANPDAADISYHCAFTFAAVTKTMGKECWSKLQVPFASLCRDTQLKTRKAMAASIHIVAETLGSDVADQEVLPQFETLLQDTGDEVRLAAIRNVAAILRVATTPASQKRVLKSLEAKAAKAENNWRLRHLVASQVGPICEALGTSCSADEGSTSKEDLTWSVLVPLLLKLCQDAVAEVRDEAARGTARALRAAAPELFDGSGTEGSSGCYSGERQELPPKTANLVRHLIKVFARGRSFRHRMTYIRMCDSVIRDSPPQNVLTERLFKPLARLATDKVKNVRLCWATTIHPHLRMNRLGQSHAVLAAAHKMAREDSDKEVCRILANAPIAELPEGADVSLGPESDLDETGDGETLFATEGGTGESSECSEVAAGDDVQDTVDPDPVSESGNSSNSSSSPLDAHPPEGSSPPASSQSESSPETSSTSTDNNRSPTGSSSSSPVQSPEGKKSSSGLSASHLERRLAPSAPSFDPMEDCLVDQREIEKDMDEQFTDRRLFHEAQTDAPQLKAEKAAPLVNSSELAQRLQAQQEKVDSKANTAVVEEAEAPQDMPDVSVVAEETVDVASKEDAPIAVESSLSSLADPVTPTEEVSEEGKQD